MGDYRCVLLVSCCRRGITAALALSRFPTNSVSAAPSIAQFEPIRRRYSSRIGDAMDSSSNAPEQPRRVVEGQEQLQLQQQRQGEERQVFDFSCESYTPQMWMDALERLNASRNDGSCRFDVCPLHVAAFCGRTDVVECMLAKGYDKDELDRLGRTPLYVAAEKGLMPMTQALLTAGADASLRCHDYWSALEWAVAKGHVDIARVIIEHGADVNATGKRGLKPLHIAAALSDKPEMVSLLCLKGADVDALDRDGRTPLQLSALTGCMPVAQALLTSGADVRVRRCDTESSALDFAVNEGHVGIARAFIEHGADVNAADTRGNTPLHDAAATDSAEMVSLLCLKAADVDKANDEGRPPLHVAVLEGHIAVIRALLDAGPDVTLRDNTVGLSPLDIAAGKGHADVLRTLVEYGADVNAASSRDPTAGFTALHVAAIENKAGAIDVLVKAGANIAQEDSNGDTPLHHAAHNSSLATVLVLLKHGASTSKQNAAGYTPLHFAAAKAGTLGTTEAVENLLRQGADEKTINSNGQTAADVVGSQVEEQNSLAEDVERVCTLLANAPADRAWRRRGFLVLCRAHYPGGRVQLRQASNHGHAGIAKRTRSRAKSSRAEVDWAGVASMLIGNGADLIFETIVGYL